MSICMNSHCVDCLLRKHNEQARALGDEQAAYEFSRAVMALFLSAAPSESSAELGAKISALYRQHYGLPEDQFREEKQRSNRFVLQHLPAIRTRVADSPDPIKTALSYAIMGNYIDFSALGKNVSFASLEEMLTRPESFCVDEDAFTAFCEELSHAKTLLYVTDNAGEIGFDWVLADTLSRRFPQLAITFLVRGKPALNDATQDDYAFFGIPYPVIGNGSDIGGTSLAHISPQALQALQCSDLILAKGMGNTETLYGSGLPVYFAFLAKCKRLQQVFHAEFMQPVLAREPQR